ncbi:MAG: hypothetical protein ACKPKO_46335, partial [Candidatus Fonsibacter sp.]
PMEWPESVGARWLNRMIEDAAEKTGTLTESNLIPFMQRNVEEFDKLVAKASRPTQFTHMAANLEIANKGHRWPEDNYALLLKNGVYGAFA